MSDFISFLFKTNALNICPENSPFWYTSGKQNRTKHRC